MEQFDIVAQDNNNGHFINTGWCVFIPVYKAPANLGDWQDVAAQRSSLG